MARVGFLLLAVLTVAAADRCRMGSKSLYPPPANTTLQWVTIDLDKAPQDRWTELVAPLAGAIKAMILQVVDLLPEKFRDELVAYTDQHADTICANFPAPYGDEIIGIQKATGIDLSLLVLFNIAYEIEGACTSIVAQDEQGNIFHARNLDFGLFFGWDKANQTWTVAELLRPLLFNARFIKGGEELYRSTLYAGYVGLLTGLKKGAFSISVDTRFDNNVDRGLFQWLKGDHSGTFLSFSTRFAIETAPDYDAAFQILNNTKLVGPAYIILGGVKASQGAVFTREEALSIRPLLLSDRIKNGSFYVLETNYDWWVKPPFFDDRRFPAEDCMARIGSSGVNFANLFDVLSARPNLNMLTTYTTLMHVATGELEAYKQRCEMPCPLW